MTKELRTRYLVLVSVGLVCILADQVAKVWARGHLRSPEDRTYLAVSGPKKRVIKVVPHRIELRLSYNRGAAFGMFNEASGSARWWLVVVGLLALGVIGYLLHRPESKSRLFVVALAMVAGGALGNLTDRILFGKVTDYVVVWVFKSISWTNPWPAFNVADAVLVVGVALMMIQVIWDGFRQDREEKSKGSAS